ncbi:MAG: DegT/DnrJ/EryC1/StrS family aminotransferase [Clostridia bacterium]|nr:DegT/DnrJ/EryC1/StrS family aminotransferase [Clostridia bacterium]
MAIQLFVPTFDVEACLSEIRECLEKGWPGMGFKTLAFEEEWKKYTGHKNAYFLNSATAGLNLAFDILKENNNWADNDEVITTPLTFISTNHAIALAGLKPVFADVDEYLCLDPESVKKMITKKTKAIIFVGLGGNTGRYEEIKKICKDNGLKLILDAAHMSGTRLNGKFPGLDADVAVYSFQAVKNLPTADSGMICFADEKLDKEARVKAWLGINKDTYARTSAGGNYKWKYDVEYIGNKYHGNSIMAAIGLVQLRHLEEDNEYRRKIAAQYRAGFAKCDKIKTVPIPEGCLNSQHLFQIIVDDRDGLLAFLNENDIYPGVHYIENTQYRMYDYAKGTCPKATYVSDHVLSLPLHMRLTEADVNLVIEKVLEYVQK